VRLTPRSTSSRAYLGSASRGGAELVEVAGCEVTRERSDELNSAPHQGLARGRRASAPLGDEGAAPAFKLFQAEESAFAERSCLPMQIRSGNHKIVTESPDRYARANDRQRPAALHWPTSSSMFAAMRIHQPGRFRRIAASCRDQSFFGSKLSTPSLCRI